MDSCPKELKPFYNAHKIKMEEQDRLQHIWWKNYGISAFMVAIDHFFNGKKAKAEFIKEPILPIIFENVGLTEEDIYEKELKKALQAEEQWIMVSKQKCLPETII